ncbi:MAG: tol-pal system-associated acyl-CoA thioesterase [Azospirillum sp.]|nr:tol-pal system-associated acyl-CoA thioesterase [Azospirillum sp.]
MPDGTASPAAAVHHRWTVRVYYEDTDAGGIVYYANYLRFAERARTEMLRTIGVEQSALCAATGVTFAVLQCEIAFVAPARLDDLLEVATRITDIGGASLTMNQTIRRGERDLVRATVKVVCLNQDGRPARLPAAVRVAVAGLIVTSEKAGTET